MNDQTLIRSLNDVSARCISIEEAQEGAQNTAHLQESSINNTKLLIGLRDELESLASGCCACGNLGGFVTGKLSCSDRGLILEENLMLVLHETEKNLRFLDEHSKIRYLKASHV